MKAEANDNSQDGSDVTQSNYEVKEEVAGDKEITCPFFNGRRAEETAVNGLGESTVGDRPEGLDRRGEPRDRPEGVAAEDESTVSTSEDLKTEETQSNGDEDVPVNRQPVVLPGGIVMPPPRVETINTSWKTQHLTAEQINEYCRRLFKFKNVNIMHFK